MMTVDSTNNEAEEAMSGVGREIDPQSEIKDLEQDRGKMWEENPDRHKGEGTEIGGIQDLSRQVDCQVGRQVPCIHRAAQEIEAKSEVESNIVIDVLVNFQ